MFSIAKIESNNKIMIAYLLRRVLLIHRQNRMFTFTSVKGTYYFTVGEQG